MTTANETYDVFVSYSRADGRHASEIDSVLRTNHLKSFFDRRNLDAGLPWVRATEKAIGAAKAAIVLIGPGGFGNTQHYERELAIIRQTRQPTFRVIPVILPKARSDLPFDFLQNLTWFDFSQVEKVSDAPDQLERLVAAIQGGLTAVDEVRQAICPWRGLDAFREEDSAFFCGRGSESEPQSPIGQLVHRVRAHSFVMVVGRSGSGKSSLVFAGLIPALRRERNRFWKVLTVRPGQTPLRALAAAFNPPADDEGAAGYETKISQEAEQLRTGDLDLLGHMTCRHLDRAEGKPDRLLLYVDQWEELYAQAPSSGDKERASQHGADANRFVDLLLAAARTAPVTVIGTVRADFYDPLIGHPDLRALLPTRQILLARMSRSELQSTIDGPAKKVGLTFDPVSLVQRILDEAGQDESVLPLLQYALKESWALRKANAITADAYARSGGVREAIRITADRAFNALSAEDKRIARRLFLRLVTPGEGKEDTRARAAMPLEPTQRKIVELFADARTRLLVTGSDDAHQPTIEIAHEALIRTWPQLREWIDAHREKLRARAAAVQAKAEWEQNQRRDDLLLPAGFQLERAKDLLKDPGDLTVDDIQSFIDRSSEREKRERKEREEQQRRLGALTIFSLGIQSVPAGSNSHSSNAKPQPLTELEEAILIAAVGRAAGSTDDCPAIHFFLFNDTGTYFIKRLETIDPAEPITADLLLRRAADCKVKIFDKRPDFPREFPYYLDSNRFMSNVPGSTILFPVVDTSRQYINALMSSLAQPDGLRPAFRDDRNFYLYAGVRKWVRSGFLNKDIVVPLGGLGTQGIQIEAELLLQNLILMLKAMGLGGWIHECVTPTMLLPALGFTYATPGYRPLDFMRWGTFLREVRSHPVGLPPHIQGMCPPYYKSMVDAVQAVADAKYRLGRTYGDDAYFRQISQGDRGAKYLADIPHYRDEVVACTKDICTYIYEFHGRFPAHCDAVFVPGVWLQAHHLV
jgi:TIR domain